MSPELFVADGDASGQDLARHRVQSEGPTRPSRMLSVSDPTRYSGGSPRRGRERRGVQRREFAGGGGAARPALPGSASRDTKAWCTLLAMRTGALLCCAWLGLLGCPKGGPTEEAGDDSSGSGGSTRRLDQLETSEIQDVCRNLNDELATRFSNRRLAIYACTRMYIRRGDSLTCAEQVDECLLNSPGASLGAPRPLDFQIDNAECAGLRTCPVTTAQLDDCLADRFDQREDQISLMTCNLADDPDAVTAALAAINSAPPAPESCAPVAANCPGL